MTQCPVEQVSAVRRDNGRDKGYDVDGCGRHARCTGPDGPCREVFTEVQRLDIARRTFAQETNCPVIDVKVYFDGPRLVTDGCGRYAHCPEIGGPCFTIPRPTCESIALKRLDACRAGTVASQPQNPHATWENPAQVAGAVGEVVKVSRGAKECNEHYEQELRACRQAAQPTPSAP
ncbi:MAG: hypothetical protein HY901_04090 [Deltaproteobacteria bacterium]|nr:hypothetical protein [Deltaproteobacteria bacterium]